MPDPYPGPNEEVLEAQTRVCTGPHQSRPLGKKEGDPDPKWILELIFASLKGDLPRVEQVSPAQMGAFFAAMSIRRTFGAQTGWSAAEIEAFDRYGDALCKMPEDLRFLIGMAPNFAGCDGGEARVIAALRSVLQGGTLELRGSSRCAWGHVSGRGASLADGRVLDRPADEYRK